MLNLNLQPAASWMFLPACNTRDNCLGAECRDRVAKCRIWFHHVIKSQGSMLQTTNQGPFVVDDVINSSMWKIQISTKPDHYMFPAQFSFPLAGDACLQNYPTYATFSKKQVRRFLKLLAGNSITIYQSKNYSIPPTFCGFVFLVGTVCIEIVRLSGRSVVQTRNIG